MTSAHNPSTTAASSGNSSDKKPRPAVTVVPFDPARDAEPYARTFVLAFNETDIDHAMWPGPRQSVEDRIRWTVRGNERSSVSPETVRCTALVDGKPVGFSIWSAPRDRTATGGELTDEEKAADAAHEAELEATKEAIDIERDAHWGGTFWKGFKKAMEKGRKARYAGQPYWLLEILAVNPAAQGLGVGKALLAWGFERADKDQLPIYLEATVAGKPVYERSLFEAVGDIAFAGSQPGTELSLLAMERPPQPVAKPSADVVAEAKADDVVLSLVDDADWPEVIRTKLLAMVGDPLYETSAPVARRPDFETQVKWGVYSQRRMSPEVARDFEFVKATRPSQPGRILGFAVWEKPRFPTEAHPDPAPASERADRVDEELEAIFAASEDRVFLKDFKTRGRKIREDYHAGAPFWYLGLLVVHPDSQGLGVGKRLINWGLNKADAVGLPTHCESSPIGERIYPRFGFEPIGWLEWTYVDGTAAKSPSFCRQPKKTTA